MHQNDEKYEQAANERQLVFLKVIDRKIFLEKLF
jgi:hypothetical protein